MVSGIMKCIVVCFDMDMVTLHGPCIWCGNGELLGHAASSTSILVLLIAIYLFFYHEPSKMPEQIIPPNDLVYSLPIYFFRFPTSLIVQLLVDKTQIHVDQSDSLFRSRIRKVSLGLMTILIPHEKCDLASSSANLMS